MWLITYTHTHTHVHMRVRTHTNTANMAMCVLTNTAAELTTAVSCDEDLLSKHSFTTLPKCVKTDPFSVPRSTRVYCRLKEAVVILALS